MAQLCRSKRFIGDVVPDDVRLVPDGRMFVLDGTILQWLLTLNHMVVPEGTGCVSNGTFDAAERLFSYFDILFIFSNYFNTF